MLKMKLVTVCVLIFLEFVIEGSGLMCLTCNSTNVSSRCREGRKGRLARRMNSCYGYDAQCYSAAIVNELGEAYFERGCTVEKDVCKDDIEDSYIEYCKTCKTKFCNYDFMKLDQEVEDYLKENEKLMTTTTTKKPHKHPLIVTLKRKQEIPPVQMTERFEPETTVFDTTVSAIQVFNNFATKSSTSNNDESEKDEKQSIETENNTFDIIEHVTNAITETLSPTHEKSILFTTVTYENLIFTSNDSHKEQPQDVEHEDNTSFATEDTNTPTETAPITVVSSNQPDIIDLITGSTVKPNNVLNSTIFITDHITTLSDTSELNDVHYRSTPKILPDLPEHINSNVVEDNTNHDHSIGTSTNGNIFKGTKVEEKSNRIIEKENVTPQIVTESTSNINSVKG